MTEYPCSLAYLSRTLHHLLADAGGNFVLLRLEIVVGVFIAALKRLLLAINLLQQIAAGVFIQLVAGSAELFLQIFDFAVQRFKFVALRVELLSQRFKIALAFVGTDNCGLDIHDPNFCGACRSRGCRAGVWTGEAGAWAGEAGADPVCANVAIESTATTSGTKREE